MVSWVLPLGSAASPRAAPPGRLRLGVPAPCPPVVAVSLRAGRSGLPPRGLSPGSTLLPERVSTMICGLQCVQCTYQCAVSPALAPPFRRGCRPRTLTWRPSSPRHRDRLPCWPCWAAVQGRPAGPCRLISALWASRAQFANKGGWYDDVYLRAVVLPGQANWIGWGGWQGEQSAHMGRLCRLSSLPNLFIMACPAASTHVNASLLLGMALHDRQLGG